MIVRILGEGQLRVDDAAATELHALDVDVEGAVECGGIAIAASGGLGTGLVENIHGHGGLPGCGFNATCIVQNCIVRNINNAGSHLIVRN